MADEIPIPRVRRVDQPYLVPDEIQAAIDRHDQRAVELLMMGFETVAELHLRARDALLAETRE